MDTAPPRPTRTRRRRIAAGAATAALTIAGIALASYVTRERVAASYQVRYTSMLPTLTQGDVVLVSKHEPHDLERGIIVVINNPDTDDTVDYVVKRIIGLPGDIVATNAGTITINGVALNEPWLPTGVTTALDNPVTVAADSYFVLGDNRDVSVDSRDYGNVERSEIIGRVLLRIWPHTGTL